MVDVASYHCLSDMFIINDGKAKGSDIRNLIYEIRDRVKKEYGIELKIEQEIVE